jgi:hypothetical protein
MLIGATHYILFVAVAIVYVLLEAVYWAYIVRIQNQIDNLN